MPWLLEASTPENRCGISSATALMYCWFGHDRSRHCDPAPLTTGRSRESGHTAEVAVLRPSEGDDRSHQVPGLRSQAGAPDLQRDKEHIGRRIGDCVRRRVELRTAHEQTLPPKSMYSNAWHRRVRSTEVPRRSARPQSIRRRCGRRVRTEEPGAKPYTSTNQRANAESSTVRLNLGEPSVRS